MYYQALEQIANNVVLKYAVESDIEAIDAYLASLSAKQAQQISPWRISQKINVHARAIAEILIEAAKKSLVMVKYELWHPETRIKVFETTNLSELKSPFDDGDNDPIEFVADDIKISFVLLDVRAINNQEQEKKKSFSILNRQPILFQSMAT